MKSYQRFTLFFGEDGKISDIKNEKNESCMVSPLKLEKENCKEMLEKDFEKTTNCTKV